MNSPIADRAAFTDATQLIESHGANAADEATERARRSRDTGNLVAFCRWRQAKRAIALIAGEHLPATIH